MKQYLWLKVIAGLLGLGLLLMGISVMEADPTLRETQQVTMEDIEAGRLPRDGQHVRLGCQRALGVEQLLGALLGCTAQLVCGSGALLRSVSRQQCGAGGLLLASPCQSQRQRVP